MPELRWHYTTGEKFKLITESGAILPTALFLSPGERAAVWFSSNQFWEPTAAKVWLGDDGSQTQLDMAQTAERGEGLVRFGVLPEVAPHNWNEFKRLSGVHSRMAKGMYSGGISQGAKPSEWYVTFDPVPREKWAAVEVWQDEKWIRVLPEPEPK